MQMFNNKIVKFNKGKNNIILQSKKMYIVLKKKKYFIQADIDDTEKLPNTETER